MPSPETAPSEWGDWTDPRYFDEVPAKEARFIPIFLRQLLPEREQRTRLTVSGWVLILVAMGIGSAAYNTSSNILFLTLSVLLSCLVLSGILSAVNFRSVAWDLRLPEHLRAGEVGMVEVDLRNGKKLFPCLGVWFELSSDAAEYSDRLYLRHALASGGSTRLESAIRPPRRGVCTVSVSGVLSQFPFGFLRKRMGTARRKPLRVWPARVGYRFDGSAGGRRHPGEASGRRAGQGTDLLNVRSYERGDPPRLIHWKASARTGRLTVRQLAEEHARAFTIRVETDRGRWEGERFERLCSLVCSLAEDLFHQGRLERIDLDGTTPVLVRGAHDLHDFFDRMAEVRVSGKPAAPALPGADNAISFRPSGRDGITIFIGDHVAGEINS